MIAYLYANLFPKDEQAKQDPSAQCDVKRLIILLNEKAR